MSDLQLGLLLLGIAAVAGVLAYNRWQEHRARRETERAFAARHSDVLLGEGEAPAAPRAPSRRPGEAVPPTPAATASAAPSDAALPDAKIDYIVVLRVPTGIPGAAALEAWRPIEQRFGRRALLAGSGGAGWKRVLPGGFDSFNALQASLQLVSRSGVVGDAELVEFRTEVETLAARLRAEVSAPEMRAALDYARELDALCADTDIQVALHLVKSPADGDLREQVEAAVAEAPYAIVGRKDGVTLLLDLPRTPSVLQAYAEMASDATGLAARLGARLIDDRGQPLDERALSAIASQLEPVQRRLAEAGIPPGGSIANRLFS